MTRLNLGGEGHKTEKSQQINSSRKYNEEGNEKLAKRKI